MEGLFLPGEPLSSSPVSVFFSTHPAALALCTTPRTSLTALKAIYTLPEEHVSEFLDSYKLFSQEHVTGKNREAENTVNYYKVRGSAADRLPGFSRNI